MKKKCSRLSVLLALAMMLVLCACGGGQDSGGTETTSKAEETVSNVESADSGAESVVADSKAETESVATESTAESTAAEPGKEWPVEGTYAAFAVYNEGYLVDAEGLGMNSVITLEEGGKGSMTMGEDVMAITSWTNDNGTLTITMEDESSANAQVKEGLLELDIYGTGTMLLYYAQEGADTSAYKPLTVEEFQDAYIKASTPDSRLYGLLQSMDATAGMHLKYDLHVDYLDSTQSLDVHEKDGTYYSFRTTTVSGSSTDHVTYCKDGVIYSLYPDKMTGNVATTIVSYTPDMIAQMDSLYSDIYNFGSKTEYTEETREMDGASYTVEVFPATDYTPEAAFYFDDGGKLAYYVKGAPVIELTQEVGESVYTIHVIDTEVDETLFDISGYQIEE